MTQPGELTTQGPGPFALGPGDGSPFTLPTRGQGTVKLDTSGSGGALSVFELVMESGEGPGLHVHSREHELWYVLEGEFRFLLGDALVHEPAGGLAFGPRGTPHTFQNIGAGTGRLLVITGPSGLEDFFLEYDRRASGPYDPAALEEAARVAGLDFVGPALALSNPPPCPQRDETGLLPSAPRVHRSTDHQQDPSRNCGIPATAPRSPTSPWR